MAASLEIPFSAMPEQAAVPVAVLERVSKCYRNGVTAVDNLSLALYPGEVVALLGPNGARKSTAIKLLMGLGAPTSGTVHVFGKDPRYAGNRLRTGVMLQVGRAPETLKVREHLELFRGYYPHPLPATDLVRLAGLEGMEDRLFGQLSGGGKQRVLFALALAGDPDSSSSTSPPWASISKLAGASGRPSASSPPAAKPFSSPPITSKKPTRLPAASWS